jgi:signal peptidase I
VPADELRAVPASLRGGPVPTTVQYAITALWVGAIPALLAGVVLRYLVPLQGDGFRGLVAWLGHQFGLYLGVALFFLFAALARYWRYRLPGGRYASTLPVGLVARERDADRLRRWASDVALFERLRAGPARLRAQRTLAGEELGALDTALGEFRAAIVAGDAKAAAEARRALEAVGASVLAWSQRRRAFEAALTIALPLLALFGLRTWVVRPYQVTSASMLPTLDPEDRIAGNELAYTLGSRPKRGDVVVFQTSAVALSSVVGLPLVLTKRVVGLPGDAITMNGSAPVINGWEVPGCEAGDYLALPANETGKALQAPLFVEFLGDRAYLTLRGPATTFRGPYVVKAGEVFVLGDNRGNSMDSRAYNRGTGGGVPLEAIDARAQWFLAGTHRSGETDFGRFLHPIDDGAASLRLAGLDGGPLEAAVARCLRSRPERTVPPPPVPRPPGDGLAAQDAGN